MTLRVRAPRADGLPRQCAILMRVMDWALNRRSVLEDVAICMSKCASMWQMGLVSCLVSVGYQMVSVVICLIHQSRV